MASRNSVPTNKAGRPILASLYDLTEFDSDEEKDKYPQVPIRNLVSAALFVTRLFADHDIPVAVLGGFALRLLGGTRDTRDVDMVFQAPRKFAQMWDIIDQEFCLIIPKQRTVSDVVKIFVKTGGEWDECAKKMPIEVDLVQAGSNGSPNDVLGHRQAISVGPGRTLYIVDLFYLLKGKFHAFATREFLRDREDIMFLFRGNESKIRSFRESLDPQEVLQFVESHSGNARNQYTDLFGIQSSD